VWYIELDWGYTAWGRELDCEGPGESPRRREEK